MANVGVTFDFAAESAKLRTEIDKVRKQIGGLNATVKGIEKGFKFVGGAVAGAFSIGAIGAWVGKINSATESLNDLADSVGGASVSGLQALQVAAGQTGGSAEALGASITKMGATIGDAMAGNKAASESFARLGLSAQQLAALKPDEAFRLIADRLAAVPNAYERASAAQDIFGKGAKGIAGLLTEGGAAIDEVNRKLEEQGARLNDLDAKKIGIMNDELQFQQTVVTNLGIKFLSGLTPAVGVATGAVGEMIGRLGGATEAGKLFGTIMVGGLKIVETAAYGLAATFETVRAVISGMLAIIADGIGSVLGGVASTAEFFGLSIAGPIRNAADLMDGIGASLQNVSDKARENAVQAASYAIEAAVNIVKAGEIFNAAQADYERKAAESAARNQALMGGGTGYTAPETDKDKKDKDPKLELSKATLYGTNFDLDPFKDPAVLKQISINDTLQAMQDQHDATMLGKFEMFGKTQLGMALANAELMEMVEQNKNATLGDAMGTLVGMAIQQSGALGKVGKALAIASTIYSTSSAIMKVWSQLGWPAAIGPSAQIAAMGIAQLANIRKTNIGSSGSISSGSLGGGGSAATAPALPDNVGPQGQPLEQQSTVQIIVNGAVFAAQETVDWLVEQIGDAVNSRDLVFINGNSRQAMELAGS